MGAAVVLTILRNGETIKTCPIEGEVMLGRGEGCVIRLEDRAISRQHALFRPVAGGVQVEKRSDFAPLNVNGSECTKAVLKEGDVISIGPYLMKLSVSAQQAAPAAPAAVPTPVPTATGADFATAPLSAIPLASDSLASLSLESAAPNEVVGDSDGPGATAILSLSSIGMNGGSDPSVSGSGPSISLAPPPGFDGNAAAGAPLELETPSDSGPSLEPIDEEGATKILPAAKVEVKLIFKPGQANHTEYVFDKDEVVIGRGKECDIVLNDKKASRKNTTIIRSGMSFMVRDLGSSNGTYVEGVKIEERQLHGDEKLRIGGVEFQFKVLNRDYMAKKDSFEAPVKVEPAAQTGSNDMMGLVEHGVPLPMAAPGASPVNSVFGGTVSINGIAGIAGMEGAAAVKPNASLLEKFRALPPRKRIIYIAVTGLLVMTLLDLTEEEPVKKPKGQAAKSAQTAPAAGGATAAKGQMTFEMLTPEQRRNVQSWHDLAFDYYRNREYDKALFELNKIFQLIPDFLDSRDIERYAKEGKRKLETLEEEKRKREEEQRIKARIAELTDQAQALMTAKQYDKARELFPELLNLDPDNARVPEWNREIDEVEQQKQLEEQAREVRREINRRAWEIVGEGEALRKKEKYNEAIDTFRKALEVGSGNSRKLTARAKELIEETKAELASKFDPVLAGAKSMEDSGDLPNAYREFEKAAAIDPRSKEPKQGMNRIRDVLTDRAKAIYTEAVLAESYSDFPLAKKKFEECLNTAPRDSIYYERSQRKLKRYFRHSDLNQTEP